ncbi:MAG: Unknown protein [uncultured Thiotrichaceae bacterium]|uniref:Uncharacterized protein n=1 Tax=uncultured Thiotrichaceae bacterium TaxID=298394 RepID=A0A6S6TWA4_9GAMM|nr:MAG: Unknown protein [uncultured Thiotrichaceae bacterium]
MNKNSMQLVTIVCEAMLEPYLERELPALGAEGYTITDARGMGKHMGKRNGGWRKESNIKVEVLCTDVVAERLISHVLSKYNDNYALIVYSHERTVYE